MAANRTLTEDYHTRSVCWSLHCDVDRDGLVHSAQNVAWSEADTTAT